MKGIYCLVTSLRKDKKLKFGRSKKENAFPKGFYCYVGSGMKNLESRINRHLSENKKKFWHIDYLLDYTEIMAIKRIHTNKKIECKVSEKMKEISEKDVKGFGSSDCKCSSHLYYFKENPLGNEKFLSIFDLE